MISISISVSNENLSLVQGYNEDDEEYDDDKDDKDDKEAIF